MLAQHVVVIAGSVAPPSAASLTKEDDGCLAWIGTKRRPRSVVYAAFGSVSAPTAAQMAEVAEGLYNCGNPFLWVVRASETEKIPASFADKAC